MTSDFFSLENDFGVEPFHKIKALELFARKESFFLKLRNHTWVEILLRLVE